MRTVAYDHDFKPHERVTPFGIFLPQHQELYLFLVTSKVTADCIVDILEQWWDSVKDRFSSIERWVINADNGPENHSRRTQFMQRIVSCAQEQQMPIDLAYYPPYHSKYNAIERTFGWLEQHWCGALLDTVETVVNFAQTLTFKGQHPVVTLITETSQSGVKLTKHAMKELEKQFYRLPGLEKWFVHIPAVPPADG